MRYGDFSPIKFVYLARSDPDLGLHRRISRANIRKEEECLTCFEGTKASLVDSTTVRYCHNTGYVSAAVAVVRRAPNCHQGVLRCEHIFVSFLDQLMCPSYQGERIDMIELVQMNGKIKRLRINESSPRIEA